MSPAEWLGFWVTFVTWTFFVGCIGWSIGHDSGIDEGRRGE